jgi:hypothetical protein
VATAARRLDLDARDAVFAEVGHRGH